MKIIATAAIVAFCGVLQIAANTSTFLDERETLARTQIQLLNLTMHVVEVQEHIASLKNIVNIPLEFKTKVTTLFNNATRAIEDKVNAAAANGKPAGVCSVTALASLTVLNETVVAEFARTIENTTNGLLEFLHQSDIVVEAARSIGVDLFLIPKTCYSVNIEESTACTTRLSQDLAKSMENWLVLADNILRLAKSPEALLGLINSLATLPSALTETLTAVSTGIEAVQIATTTCIDALQIIQISPPRIGSLNILRG